MDYFDGFGYSETQIHRLMAKRSFQAMSGGGFKTFKQSKRAPLRQVRTGVVKRRLLRNQALSSGPEQKFVQTDFNTILTSGGAVYLLNGVATGTDNTGRIGRKTNLVNVRVRGYIQNSNVSIGSGSLLLVYDREPNGSLPTVGTIVNQAVATGNAWLPNPDQRDRFTILRTWDFVSNSTSTCGDKEAGGFVVFDLFAKLQNLETQYTGTTNAIASLANGAVYLVHVGNTGASPPLLGALANVYFYDA